MSHCLSRVTITELVVSVYARKTKRLLCISPIQAIGGSPTQGSRLDNQCRNKENRYRQKTDEENGQCNHCQEATDKK
jgi:hypothetical protein